MLQEACQTDGIIPEEMPFLDDVICGASEGILSADIMAYGACKAWILMIISYL